MKRGVEIRLLSFCLCFSAPPHPHMELPRTEICPVLKALYHLVQTLNINQYSSYFIFSFVPWAVSSNNAVMRPTGTHTQIATHNVIVQMYTDSYRFHLHSQQHTKTASHNVIYQIHCIYVVSITLHAHTHTYTQGLNDPSFILGRTETTLSTFT